MTVLKNPRHELFVKFVAGGASLSEALVSAGYSKTGAAGAAQRLLKNVAIATRLNELQQEIATNTVERVSLTREWVLESLKRNAKLGSQTDENGKPSETFNLAASNQALRMLGVELGMFREGMDHTMTWDGDLQKLSEGQLAMLIARLEQRLASESAEPGAVVKTIEATAVHDGETEATA